MKRFGKKSEEGFAILESVVFLTAFILLAVYTIDFFTAIHTGVLGSISARTYLFETLRHRSNIDALRVNRLAAGTNPTFANNKLGHERFHLVNDEDMPPGVNNILPAVGRVLTQAQQDSGKGNLNAGSAKFSDQQKTSVLYIKSGYGICTDAACAKDGG